MDKNKMNISQIERFFSMLLFKKGISDNIFLGTLPATLESTWNNMVLIDCGTSIFNYNSHGFGSVNIFLYARPIGASMTKNVQVLNDMEATLTSVIQSSNDNVYSVKINWHDSGYDSNRNFHYNVINIETIIK